MQDRCFVEEVPSEEAGCRTQRAHACSPARQRFNDSLGSGVTLVSCLLQLGSAGPVVDTRHNLALWPHCRRSPRADAVHLYIHICILHFMHARVCISICY